MKTCNACGREYDNGRKFTCLWCGHNNHRKGGYGPPPDVEESDDYEEVEDSTPVTTPWWDD